MSDYQHIIHPIEPLYNESSRILLLGSLPSVKSREQNFFYGHPQNRFWPLMARLYGREVPRSIEEKKAIAFSCGFALWDVIYSCDIIGSSDASIRNVIPTDLGRILAGSSISAIYCNGRTAAKYYAMYQEKALGIKAVTLPSTSPANAAWDMDRLEEYWKIIL